MPVPLMTVREAATEMSISETRVRQLVNTGSLNARRVGPMYLIDPFSIWARMHISPKTAPRPLSTRLAWATLAHLNGDQYTCEPYEKHRIERYAASPWEWLSPALRDRAGWHYMYINTGLIQRLLSHPDIVIGGIRAAAHLGAAVGNPDPDILYMPHDQLNGIVKDYLMQVAGPSDANIILRPIRPGGWPFQPDQRYTGLSVALLDMLDINDRGVPEAMYLWSQR